MQTASPTLLSDLSHEGLMRVSGADAVTFLQGQLSTDIDRLAADFSQLSSWSNAKGRVVTILRLFRRDDSIYLSLPASLLAAVKKRLSMYVLRSKVTLEDASTVLARLGIAGPRGADTLKTAGLTLPDEINATTRSGDIQIIRLHGATPRYALYGSASSLAAFRTKLEATGVKSAGEEAWALEKILVGEPTVYPETTEHFVAQMLNLDQLAAIDFKKGCYIGQEVIARAHYRGAVKRHMHQASSTAAIELKPGMVIHAKGSDAPVAEIVDVRKDSNGIWQMLLVIQDESKDMELLAPGGTAISLESRVRQSLSW